MTWLSWLLFGSGMYLMGCSVQNKSPVVVLRSVLKGQPVPNEPWHPLPGVAYFVLPDGTSPDVPGVGGAVGGAVGSAIGTARQQVVAFAMAQRGERYVFGSAGPNTWDCSGLTQQAYKQVGVKLPHHAASQQKMGREVSEANAQPGDLVFWGPISGHVAMYLGNGQVVHAPKTGDVVKVAPVWGKNRSYRSYL